jgi:hypothetical protein
MGIHLLRCVHGGEKTTSHVCVKCFCCHCKRCKISCFAIANPCPPSIIGKGVVSNSLGQEWTCRNPTLAKCGGEAQHLEKSGDLESTETPECSELDRKGKTPRIEMFLVSLKRY